MDRIDTKTSHSDEELLFSAFTANKNIASNDYIGDFITLVIKLNTIDHFLFKDPQNRIDLILIKKNIENRIKIDNEDIKNVYSALLEKCNFLLKKMSFKSKETNRYSLEFERHIIPEEITFESDGFKDMSMKFDYLYNDNFNLATFWDNIRQYEINCRDHKSKASELILLMKHYQKDKVSSIQVKNLLKSFDSLYESIYNAKIKKEYNLVALDTIRNYIYNSRLSISMSEQDYSFERLKKDIAEIDEFKYVHAYAIIIRITRLFSIWSMTLIWSLKKKKTILE